MEIFFFNPCWNEFQKKKKNRSAGWVTLGTFISSGGHCAMTVEDLASQVRRGHRGKNTEKVVGWSHKAQKCSPPSSTLGVGISSLRNEKGHSEIEDL